MKHFLSIDNVTDYKALVQSALDYKSNPFKDNGLGKGKTMGMIFLNPSMRTRISTQRAARNLGMEVIVFNLDKEGWQLEFEDGAVMTGTKAEHVKEAAAVMGQYFDIIGIRTFPGLINKEEDDSEHYINQFVKYTGEVDFVITHPKGYDLNKKFTGNTHIEYDQDKALDGADFVYVKNWSSYEKYGQMLNTSPAWMMTHKKLEATHKAKVMHCLPVRRNLVIADEVLDGTQSIVIQQASNRVWAAQAVLSEILKNN